MEKLLVIGKIIIELGFLIYDKIKQRARKLTYKFKKK